MRSYFLAFIGLLLFAGACRFNPNVQGEGTPFLHGVWEQVAFPNENELLHYTYHKFRFVCDSVYIEMDTHSTVRNVVDSCYQDGHWKEYAKGLYLFRSDSLFIEADYTNEAGRQKLKGCHGTGQYLASFRVDRLSEDSVRLRLPYDQSFITLSLKNRITCQPKAR
jgi:hypothetical protein